MKPGQGNAEEGVGRDWRDERYYGVSRSLYRAAIACARRSAVSERDRVRLLDACEYAVWRLADNPASGRCVLRRLYREIRGAYALDDQPLLCTALRRGLAVAGKFVEEAECEQIRPCSAFTRKGVPCRREALQGREFCPSHRHLELLDDPEACGLPALAA